MDLTPHIVTGAAISARVRRPVVAIPLAFLSHFALDGIPHLDVVWINGWSGTSVADLGLGAALSSVVAWKVRHWWPLIGAFAAVLPDAPGLKDYIEAWPSSILPHTTWFSPWGIATEVLVTILALYWALG